MPGTDGPTRPPLKPILPSRTRLTAHPDRTLQTSDLRRKAFHPTRVKPVTVSFSMWLSVRDKPSSSRNKLPPILSGRDLRMRSSDFPWRIIKPKAALKQLTSWVIPRRRPTQEARPQMCPGDIILMTAKCRKWICRLTSKTGVRKKGLTPPRLIHFITSMPARGSGALL